MKGLITLMSALLYFVFEDHSMAQPYPPSTVITNVTFDWDTEENAAPGSDNWPITWCGDGHQYAAWGDGGGFGGTSSAGRVSLGFARVQGDFPDYEGFNVWGGFNQENPEQFGGKSYGIVCIDDILYAWWGPGSGSTSYSQTRLLISNDTGATWTQSTWDLTDTDPDIIMPTICNFGQNYSGAGDFVYHYFIRKMNSSGLNIHSPGKIDLARVHKDSMMELAAYDWYAGMNGGNPVWTEDALMRQPAFEDSLGGVGWNCSVSFNPGVGRYLLITEHDQSKNGKFGIYDAPSPWGPWTTAAYYNGWNNNSSTFFWNFSNKWSGGLGFTMVFTGVGTYDRWNVVQGEFNQIILANDILDFNARLFENTVRLKWRADGDDISEFRIRKSFDGIHFNTISSILSVKEDNHIYSYLDPVDYFNRGVIYYQIQSQLFDGAFKTSPIREVQIARASDQAVYPNPVNNTLIAPFGNGEVQVFSVEGKKMGQFMITESSPGINVAALPPGVYTLIFSAGRGVVTERFVKLE